MIVPLDTPDERGIQEALEKIIASRSFRGSPRLQELLRYVVTETLSGRASTVKAYSIAVDVFGRNPSFDPSTDTIVRVQAGRLRNALVNYYKGEGKNDRIRIEIPRGGYVPVFQSVRADDDAAPHDIDPAPQNPADPAVDEPTLRSKSTEHRAFSMPWARAAIDARRLLAAIAMALVLGTITYVFTLGPGKIGKNGSNVGQVASGGTPIEVNTVGILPFVILNAPRDEGNPASMLTSEMTTALAKSELFKVKRIELAAQKGKSIDVAAQAGVRWLIEGTVSQMNSERRVGVALVDGATGATVWSHFYQSVDGNMTKVLTRHAIYDLRPELYIAVKKDIERRPLSQATPIELFLLSFGHPSVAENGLAWEKQRILLAERASIDQKSGLAHSVMAETLSYLANVDPPSDTPERREQATAHAHRAIELAPRSAETTFGVALHHFYSGRMEEAARFARRTLELDPHHFEARLLSTAVPYACRSAPTEVLGAITALDNMLSESNPSRWLTLAWLAHLNLNNGDYSKAVEAGRHAYEIFRDPLAFFTLAAALVQVGGTSEARSIIKGQQLYWPNLDPDRFADAAISRRCGFQPLRERLQGVYRQMADAVKG